MVSRIVDIIIMINDVTIVKLILIRLLFIIMNAIEWIFNLNDLLDHFLFIIVMVSSHWLVLFILLDDK